MKLIVLIAVNNWNASLPRLDESDSSVSSNAATTLFKVVHRSCTDANQIPHLVSQCRLRVTSREAPCASWIARKTSCRLCMQRKL